ncbi:MAG: hypothetical protein ABEL76_08745, partial [Bradymonadaceae bacterium]
CPIPTFGSEADGSYRAIGLRLPEGRSVDRTDRIVGRIADANEEASGAPIVLCFFPLSNEQRREIAHKLLDRSAEGLVVDHVLAAHLALNRPDELPVALFEAA